ncbi:MAG: hypothetical protein ACPG49_10990, partial [Chitinophagales bacterium]
MLQNYTTKKREPSFFRFQKLLHSITVCVQHPPNPLQRGNTRKNSPFEGGRGDVPMLKFLSWEGKRWISKIALFLLIFTHFQTTIAQQVFPVQVSGTIIPPYSSLLSDYSDTRSQDILFTLTLNDPIEASRNVYFRITVISNGQEIMRTNPNFIPAPFQLLQFTPTMVTGSELAAYFQP